MKENKILLISDDTQGVEDLIQGLQAIDCNLRFSSSTSMTYSPIISAYKYSAILYQAESSLDFVNEVVSHIKETFLNFNTPILVSSPTLSSDEIIKVLKDGAFDVITSPFVVGEVYARIRSALLVSSSMLKNELQTRELSEEREVASETIQKLIPSEIIHQLKSYENTKPKKYNSVSVLFADMVDFTKKSSKLGAEIIIKELTALFSVFDRIVKRHNCIRLKTMGDGYMVVSGIPVENSDHALNIVRVAYEIRAFLKQRNLVNVIKWEVRIGINSGEVIGSLLGENKLLFDIFGDAVNIAARMEKCCEPNQINVTVHTYGLVRNKYEFIERLPHQIRGIGVRRMFYLKKPLNEKYLDRINSIMSNNFKPKHLISK